MKIIEHYIADVGKYLRKSKDERNDILLELKVAIDERLEALQETKKQELSDDEILDYLGTMGHPMDVANRYQDQQYLIGPSIYPIFTQAL